MTTIEADQILRMSRTILVIDWPSRDVPDSLARAGFTVVVQGGPGPDDYSAYEVKGDEVIERAAGRSPSHVDLVYSYRPIEELPDIAAMAKSIGATAMWIQSGLAPGGAKDPKGTWMTKEMSGTARKIIEAAGLVYVDQPYIADVARTPGGQR